MMKKWIYLAVFLIVGIVSVRSQYAIRNVQELENLKKLPQEKVYVHHTGPLVFAGEYVKYAFYCFNTQSSKLSDISYVGYVSLVNEKGEYILEQKIRLEDGLSQGDFFINTDVPSGNYKLLAYTQWMKNNGLDQLYKGDLVIINPYQVDQSGLQSDGPLAMDAEQPLVQEQVMDSTVVQLRFEKTVFGTREKVKFTLRNYKAALGKGNYSIKIQQKAPFPVMSQMNAMEFVPSYLNVGKEINKSVGDSIFLPEQQGELFFGSALDAKTGAPLQDANVVISIPGRPYFLELVKTNNNGDYYVYVRKNYKNPQALIQVMDTASAKLTLSSQKMLDASELDFGEFKLKPEFSEAIKKRSIYNQVENQFFSIKPDSIEIENPSTLLDTPNFKLFHLDDYTRFSTLQETLVEILGNVGYRNNATGDDYIHVTQYSEDYNEEYIQTPAIVLVDGVFIQNHELLKDFDARKIKDISVSQSKFKLGDKTYQGMVQFETEEGDFFESYEPSNGIKTPIQMPLPKKNYFKQEYAKGGTLYNEVPDYRNLLYWKPNVKVGETDMEFEFSTSDLKGEFEVILDGFTSYGKPIFTKSSIVVE